MIYIYTHDIICMILYTTLLVRYMDPFLSFRPTLVTRLPQVKVAVKISVFALAEMSWAQVQWASDDPGSVEIWVYGSGSKPIVPLVNIKIAGIYGCSSL